MENNEKSSIFKSRRFKYGSLAVTLTVLFIVLVIVLNAAIYALTFSFGWYLDLTGEQQYGITDASKELLDGVLVPGVNVKIVFCQDKDRVLEDSGGYYVYKCIESYKKAYPDNIKVEFLDINKHPELASKYTTQHGIQLYTYNIIMETDMDICRCTCAPTGNHLSNSGRLTYVVLETDIPVVATRRTQSWLESGCWCFLYGFVGFCWVSRIAACALLLAGGW